MTEKDFLNELYVEEILSLEKEKYEIINYKLPQWKKTLIAKKEGIKIFGQFAPAHFFTFEIVGDETFILSTGSGGLDNYLEKLKPVIDLIRDGMLSVSSKEENGATNNG